MHIKRSHLIFTEITPLNKFAGNDCNCKTPLPISAFVIPKQATMQVDGDNTNFDLEAEIKQHPNSLFVKCFAIKANEMNDNGDYFPREELKISTKTFVGVPVFTNHNNTDAEAARGKVIHSWWDDERDGISIIARVDSEAYPQLARGIKEKYILATSMGCAVQYSLCSICHNRSETPDDYCNHIKERKTRRVRVSNQKCAYFKHGDQEECPICRSTRDNIKTFSVDEKAFEYNYGIKFIENSFVVNPACSSCGVTEIIDPQVFLGKVASIREKLPKLTRSYEHLSEIKVASSLTGMYNIDTILEHINTIKTKLPELLIRASSHAILCDNKTCIKLAGQKELNDLNTALDLITSVSSSMLKQKDQLDLEFLSDLVSVLSDLQTVADELNQQGYGRLPSPGEGGQETGIGIGSNLPDQNKQVAHSAPPVQQNTPATGGAPKITTGPAGSAGTVTGPTAKRVIDFEKIAKIVIEKKNDKRLLIPFNLKIKK